MVEVKSKLVNLVSTPNQQHACFSFFSRMPIHAVTRWPFQNPINAPRSLLIGRARYELYLRGAILAFSGPAGPHCMGQSLCKVQTCLTVYRRLLLHRRNPSVVFAAAAGCSKAWLSGRTSSRSPFLPSPRRCRPTPCHTRSSPGGICIRSGRYWPLIGQV